MTNPFFKNEGPFTLDFFKKKFNLNSDILQLNLKINDIKDLSEAQPNDITFFHSINYKDIAKNTKATACITNDKIKKYLPDKCIKIVVENVFITSAKIASLFYPSSVSDNLNLNLNTPSIKNYSKVLFGKNILVGKNVLLGKNTTIGHNTVIEDNVTIGENCQIGSNVILRNTIIKNNVHILDGCIIGKKGFGFIPIKNENFRYPHLGYVLINDNCEIGAGCTFDRGSMSNTIIGKNTFFDNQVHLAHNVKIGENCIIAGQVGIAGSSIIGNDVMIGGQAGISGHLKIGNNVKIGGGSGVVKNIPDNCKVMGYPAKDIKNFIKEFKNK